MVYIGIGSNLGNRINNIEKAKYLLNLNGINVVKSSSYYETLSWPDPSKPKFLNIIIQSNTRFSIKKFIEISKSIEKSIGRKKSKKNAPRVCDIDIISYFREIISGNIIPLYEIDKNWLHPKFKDNIKKLIFSLPIKDIRSIKKI